jgi:signal transduction histidine kinase
MRLELIGQFFRGRGWPCARSEMLLVSYLLIIATSWFFGFAVDLPYDARLNVGLGIFLFLCLPLLYWPQCHSVLAHVLIGACLVTIFWVAAQTGGIHSMALMWPTTLSVVALLVIGLEGTVIWFGVTLMSFVVLHYLTVNHWVLSSNAHVFSHHNWAILTVTVLTVLLMIGVQLYSFLHGLQVRKLQASNLELQRTHATLLEIQNLRDEFVASVGHELRTPMNAILGFNGVLRDQIGPSASMRATVDHIHDATCQLLGLVNDILDFSQLQAGKMQLHTRYADMTALLQEICLPWQKVAKDKGIELIWHAATDFPAHILLDEKKIRKIVDNLLDNAIKFTESGAVVLKWGRQGDSFRLEVSDTGHGIAQDMQSRIFKRFERADLDTHKKYGGTGLGLAICDGLVKLHGGSIGVTSHEGFGSTFWLQMPLVAADATHCSGVLEPEIQVIPASAVFRLLLVDDNPINLMVAEIQLHKAWPELDIVSCQSGSEALRRIAQSSFDLALVDMVMPEMDGIELTHRIRGHDDLDVARMPMVAFTANVESHERQRCLDAGMNAVLTKPMDEKLMQTVISGALRQRYPQRWS